jgi:aspartate/tyrosine/aromatic aminotransferase
VCLSAKSKVTYLAACSFSFLILLYFVSACESIIYLYSSRFSHSGMDPTMDQWAEISKVVNDCKLVPFFDCAYQGFASGNAPQDAAALRMFVEEGHNLALVQSFSKVCMYVD